MRFDKRYSLDKVGDIITLWKNSHEPLLSEKCRSIFVQLCQLGSRPAVCSTEKVVLPQQGYEVGIKEQGSGTDATREGKNLQIDPPLGEGMLALWVVLSIRFCHLEVKLEKKNAVLVERLQCCLACLVGKDAVNT